MNDSDVRELLDRAAEHVRPRLPVTGSALRARARRRQRTMAATATVSAVLCVVAGVAVSTADFGAPRSSHVPATTASASPADGPTVSLPRKEKSVSMVLPAGWRQVHVDADFNPCAAEANTMYLGGDPKKLETVWDCRNAAQPWAWITDIPGGIHPSLTPQTTVIAGGELGYWLSTDGRSLTETPDPTHSVGDQVTLPWQKQVVTVVAKNEALRRQLRQSIRAPIPPKQPLVLPARADLTDAIGELLGGPFAVGDQQAARAAVDLLRTMPAVDPSTACDWLDADSLGMDLGSTKVVISKDPACLQAVSSDGGRVKVNADTADRLYGLLRP